MTTDAHETVPRFERFFIRYPSGTAFDSHWPGGVTLREVELAHVMAKVAADQDSLVDAKAPHHE